MRDRLRQIRDQLLALSRDRGEVSLDDIGDALGTEAVTAAEITELVDALEARLRVVASAPGSAVADLRVVLPAARAFQNEHGRTPTTHEIAACTGLSASAVRAALLLARVMSRPAAPIH